MLLNQALFQSKNFIDKILIISFVFLYFSAMPAQAELLVSRMKSTLGEAQFASDWKLVTFFVGGNDLCLYCKDTVRIYNI